MEKLINFLLLFFSLSILLLIALFTFFVVGTGIAEYNLDFFYQPFIVVYIILFFSSALFVFSLSLFKMKFKRNRVIGGVLIFVSVLLLVYINKFQFSSAGWLMSLFFSLFPVYLFVFSFKKII